MGGLTRDETGEHISRENKCSGENGDRENTAADVPSVQLIYLSSSFFPLFSLIFAVQLIFPLFS